MTSFIRFSACNGVFVRVSTTAHVSRFGESKVAMNGGPTVRRQYLYKLRRYRPTPLSGTYPLSLESSCHSPGGWSGFTDGPPTFSTSRPDHASASSRIISGGSRNRGPRARRRFSGSFSTSSRVTFDDCRYAALVT